MQFLQKHYDVLKALEPSSQPWVGGKLRSYAQSVARERSDCQFALLPDEAVDREYLFNMAASDHANTLTCCVAIFAWGGMRRDHARAVLGTADKWLPIADAIRREHIGRTNAYSRFMQARQSKNLPGMGPAFFTKLIYFFGEKAASRGYIMDQWTALSANLLTGRQMVEMQILKNAARVSDSNGSDVYDEFCNFIEALGKELNESADKAEMRIFSVGGRGDKQGKWRAYLKQHAAEIGL